MQNEIPDPKEVFEKTLRVTPAQLAGTGMSLWQACTGIASADDPSVWEKMAGNFTLLLGDAFAGSGPQVSATDLARRVCSWSGSKANYATMPYGTSLAWETLVRHWISCMDLEDAAGGISETERLSADWYRYKMSAAKEIGNRQANGKAKAAQQEPPPVREEGPAVTDGKSSGMKEGFRKVVEIKIAEHRGKIASLEKFLSLLAMAGPETDVALWEIFEEVLKEGRKQEI